MTLLSGASRFTICISAVLALGACGQASGPDAAATGPATEAADADAAATSVSGTGTANGTELPLTGQAFIDAASASDQFEIDSARIAQSKGLTGAWREFAQAMTRDHTKSSNDLQAAAAKTQGVQLRQAPVLTPEQQDKIQQLQSASGEAFVRLYSAQQLSAHEKALAMLTTYASSGDAQPLMDYAGKTAPVVKHHLEMLRNMQP